MSPALADRFFTAGPYGKPIKWSSCSQLGIFSQFTLDDLFNLSPRDAQPTSFKIGFKLSSEELNHYFCYSEAVISKLVNAVYLRHQAETHQQKQDFQLWKRPSSLTDSVNYSLSEVRAPLRFMAIPPLRLLSSNDRKRRPECTWFEAHAEENEGFHVAESKLGLCQSICWHKSFHVVDNLLTTSENVSFQDSSRDWSTIWPQVSQRETEK